MPMVPHFPSPASGGGMDLVSERSALSKSGGGAIHLFDSIREGNPHPVT